jgi:hypothetical protein
LQTAKAFFEKVLKHDEPLAPFIGAETERIYRWQRFIINVIIIVRGVVPVLVAR